MIKKRENILKNTLISLFEESLGACKLLALALEQLKESNIQKQTLQNNYKKLLEGNAGELILQTTEKKINEQQIEKSSGGS